MHFPALFSFFPVTGKRLRRLQVKGTADWIWTKQIVPEMFENKTKFAANCRAIGQGFNAVIGHF